MSIVTVLANEVTRLKRELRNARQQARHYRNSRDNWKQLARERQARLEYRTRAR